MSEVPQTVEGSVKWFNEEKGYGFLTVPSLNKDVFVHVKQLRASGINNYLMDGEHVRFVCNSGDKGLFATNIARINGVSNAGAHA